MTTPATDANPSLGPVFPGYDPTNHYKNVAVQVGSPTQDATTGIWYAPLAISGSISATNPSVSATGAAVPASATYLGASVAGTLTGLVATANGLKVDGSGVTQPVSAASLPLPSNAAQETGGNLATLAGIVTSSKAAVKAGAGDFTDLATLPASLTELLGDTDNLANIPAKGTAAMAGSTPVTIATNDTVFAELLTDTDNLVTLAGAISGGKMLTNMALLNGTAPLVETLGAMAGGFVTEDVIRNFTLAGKAFSATTGKNAAPGAVTLGFQLFNPANSGKNLLIYSLIILSAAAGIHDIRMTTADVSSITGWSGNNVAVTPVNNKGGGAGSSATCGYSNTSVTGTLLGSSRETTACTANAPVEVLTNGECIFLPAAASINGLAVYFNATGTNNWAITCEYLEF